jgi:hypothetical protein
MLLNVALAAAISFMLFNQAWAQDSGESTTPLKPDLPLEKPVPEVPEEEEPPPQDVPPQTVPEPTQQTPPEEEPPSNPPPEFFEEPIEVAEVIFVVDRTGSMRWPSNMSVVDEGGNPVNNATKYDVARIELIKAINTLAENTKFAIVGFSTMPYPTTLSFDTNWLDGGGGHVLGQWTAWPPAQGQPAPIGYHAIYGSSLPVWPASKTLVEASATNKANAITWAQARLSDAEVTGGTCTFDGMDIALKMVTPPPPGMGPGGEPKKSATGIYLLTDGAPTHIQGVAYGLCRVTGSYDAGQVQNDATFEQNCMALTKTKILAANVHNARIYTLGMGMNLACPNAHVWNPASSSFDFFPTQYNDKCRQFLTELAEATGGHYREVSQ